MSATARRSSTTLPCPRLGACSAIAWLGGLLAQKAHVCWGWEQTWRSSVKPTRQTHRPQGHALAVTGPHEPHPAFDTTDVSGDEVAKTALVDASPVIRDSR